MSDNRKNYMIALGAGLAFSGAALIYYWIAAGGPLKNLEEPPVVPEDLQIKLQARNLMKAVKGSSGLLDPVYFLNLLQMVSTQTKEALKVNHALIRTERRKAF